MYEKLSPGMPDDRISYILYRCTYVYIPTTEKWFLVLYILPTLFVEYHDIYIYIYTYIIDWISFGRINFSGKIRASTNVL